MPGICKSGHIYRFWKVTHEFLKRMDPDLPFYYHTSTRTKFYEGVMPAFDTKPSKKPWEKCIPDMSYWEPMIESLWLYMVLVK